MQAGVMTRLWRLNSAYQVDMLGRPWTLYFECGDEAISASGEPLVFSCSMPLLVRRGSHGFSWLSRRQHFPKV